MLREILNTLNKCWITEIQSAYLSFFSNPGPDPSDSVTNRGNQIAKLAIVFYSLRELSAYT